MTTDVALIVILAAGFVAAMFLAAAETALLRISQVRAARLADGRGHQGARLRQLC